MENLMTIEEAARFAHVSPQTIKYWKKTGRLQTVPKRISARSGKPYGQLVPRSELVKAMPNNRAADLKKSHPGNLLTVSEISDVLKINRKLVYKLAHRYGLTKYKVDGWTWMVDGEDLWNRIKEDHDYAYLTDSVDHGILQP